MGRKPEPDPAILPDVFPDATDAKSAPLPGDFKIETPVIQMQDLEHVATSRTRVSNKGVKIEPTLDESDQRDLAREDEAAIQALEEFEQQIKRQPPT